MGSMSHPLPSMDSASLPTGLQPDDVSFETLCNFMESLNDWRHKPGIKKLRIEGFIDHVVDRSSRSAFSIFRLVLPDLDRERGRYGLKEASLGKLIIKAIGWEETDPRADGIRRYRHHGHNDTDSAGRLSRIIEQVGRTVCGIKDSDSEQKRKELKIGDVNTKLSALAKATESTEKEAIIRYFLEHTTPRNLKWLVQIILGNAGHGTGEAMILGTWHKDAKEYFNARGQDLRAVFNTLIDKDRTYTTGLQLGKSVRPQLACVVHSVQEALKKITAPAGARGRAAAAAPVPAQADKPFLIESKFDGERIQIHRDGDVLNYYSRRSIDHGYASSYDEMNAVIKVATGDHDKVILDGEMVAWNRAKRVMVPFGVLKRVFNAVRDKKESSTLIVSEEGIFYDTGASGSGTETQAPPGETQGGGNGGNGNGMAARIEHRLQDLELLYIVFDLLYDDAQGGSVVDYPLEERRERLAAAIPAETSVAVAPPNPCGVMTRVIPLIPGQTVLYPGGPLLSWKASTQDDVDVAVKAAQARREEGVILKRLDSPWSVNDRYSHSWLKIKPDYLSTFDIDAVILGGYMGQGERGGIIGQYVLGLRCDPPPGESPLPGGVWFKTFCKVGTGLSVQEREDLHRVLEEAGMYKGGRGSRPPHGVTARVPPEYWVSNPIKSQVLSVKSDVRLISTAVYATNFSLRFPTIKDWRTDRSAESVDVDGELLEKMKTKLREEAEAGLTGRKKGGKGGGRQRKKGKLAGPDDDEKKAVEKTKVECDALAGKKIYVRPSGGDNDRKKHIRCVIKAAGGTPIALLGYDGKADYVVAFGALDHKDINDYMEAGEPLRLKMGIVTPEWVEACREAGQLVPLRPRHMWHMSPKEYDRPHDVDMYGAPYFERTTAADVQALVSRHIPEAVAGGRALPLDPSALLQVISATPAPRPNGKPPPRAAVTGEAARKALEEAAKEERRLRSRGAVPGPRLLLPWLDAELEARGALNRSGSVLHGCTLLLLELPAAEEANPPAVPAPAAPEHSFFMLTATVQAEAAAKRATESVRRLRFSQLRIQARQLGAAVVGEMSAHVTHIVGVTTAYLDCESSFSTERGSVEPPKPTPEALLRAVAERGGGTRGVAALRVALQAGEVALVTAEWIRNTASVAAAAAAAVRYLEGRSDDDSGGGGGGGGGGGASMMIDFSASEGAGPSTGPPAQQVQQVQQAQQGAASALEPAADVAIERPDPVEYPLMNAMALHDLVSWPWAAHGVVLQPPAPLPAPVPVPVPAAAAVAAAEAMAVDEPDAEMSELPTSRRRGTATKMAPPKRTRATSPLRVAAAPAPAPRGRGRGRGKAAAPSQSPMDVHMALAPGAAPVPGAAPRGRGRGRGRGKAAAPPPPPPIDIQMAEEEEEEAPPPRQMRGGTAVTGGGGRRHPQAAANLSQASQPFGTGGMGGGRPMAPAAKVPRIGDAAAPGAALQSQPAAAGPSQRPQHTFASFLDQDPEPEEVAAGTAAGGSIGGAGPSTAAGAGSAPVPSIQAALDASQPPAASLPPSQAAPSAGGGASGAVPSGKMTLKQKIEEMKRKQQEREGK